MTEQKRHFFNNKITISVESDIYSLLQEIMDYALNDEDVAMEIIKFVDGRLENVDFTQKIYNWAREELLKEGELPDTDPVCTSRDWADSFVELFNKNYGREIIRKVDEHVDEDE